MKKIALRAATVVALSAAAFAVQAHNVWLLPSDTVLSKPDWVTVDAAVSNDLFFFNHVPLALDNLRVTAPDGSAVQAENQHKGKFRSVFDLNLQQPGTYRIAVVNQGATANWKDKATGQGQRARGTSESLARQIPADAQELKVTQSAGRVETFVSVGKPSPLQPSGQGLELLPVTHPTDLVKGEKATFAMHIDGRPAPNLDVSLTPGQSRYRNQIDEITVKTDAQGQFSVTWPQAGMYWLEASAKDGKTTLPQASERRLSYTATLEVLP